MSAPNERAQRNEMTATRHRCALPTSVESGVHPPEAVLDPEPFFRKPKQRDTCTQVTVTKPLQPPSSNARRCANRGALELTGLAPPRATAGRAGRLP